MTENSLPFVNSSMNSSPQHLNTPRHPWSVYASSDKIPLYFAWDREEEERGPRAPTRKRGDLLSERGKKFLRRPSSHAHHVKKSHGIRKGTVARTTGDKVLPTRGRADMSESYVSEYQVRCGVEFCFMMSYNRAKARYFEWKGLSWTQVWRLTAGCALSRP